jgi:hypothetical protein
VSKLEKIKELSATCTLTDAYLLLREISDFKRHYMQELDFIWERERLRQQEHERLIAEARELVTHLRALHRVNLRLINQIHAPRKIKRRQEP